MTVTADWLMAVCGCVWLCGQVTTFKPGKLANYTVFVYVRGCELETNLIEGATGELSSLPLPPIPTSVPAR